jgi:hypothetical protein
MNWKSGRNPLIYFKVRSPFLPGGVDKRKINNNSGEDGQVFHYGSS